MNIFHALYVVAETGYFWRQFEADDFDHALEQAKDAMEEEESLVSLIRIQ